MLTGSGTTEAGIWASRPVAAPGASQENQIRESLLHAPAPRKYVLPTARTGAPEREQMFLVLDIHKREA